jgi:hypothetical protein
MSLLNRLRRLEGSAAHGCPTCTGWPVRALFTGEPDPVSPPAACPRCKRVVRTIRVIVEIPAGMED